MSRKMNFLINTARTYTRWISRRPSKVLEPKHLKEFEKMGKVELEEYNKIMNPKPIATNVHVSHDRQIDQDSNITDLTPQNNKATSKETKGNPTPSKSYKSIKKYPSPDQVQSAGKQNFIVVDEATNIEYEKLKMGDAKFSSLMVSIKSRKYRQQSNQILLEGRRLIRDALEADLKLQKLMFSKVEHLSFLSKYLNKFDRDPNCNFYKVPHGDMGLWSDLTTNPGIMGLFTRPNQYYIPQRTETPAVPITVICDNIREPTNLGSIIRTCAAIPCHQLLLMKGCVDPWDTKVLRAGSGGHFRLTLLDDIVWNNIKEHLPENVQVFLAESNTDHAKIKLPMKTYDDLNYNPSDGSNDVKKHNVLVIGGETEGISYDAYMFANFFNGHRVHIPLAQGVDSLNAASALSVLTFEMRRQLIK